MSSLGLGRYKTHCLEPFQIGGEMMPPYFGVLRDWVGFGLSEAPRRLGWQYEELFGPIFGRTERV